MSKAKRRAVGNRQGQSGCRPGGATASPLPASSVATSRRTASGQAIRLHPRSTRNWDVSGRERPSIDARVLSAAIEANRGADERTSSVAAYFESTRSGRLKVQGELMERVEKAGGEVFAVDNRSGHWWGPPPEWFSSTQLGAMAEYVRRNLTRSAAGEAQAARRRRGAAVLPYPNVPARLSTRREMGVLVVETQGGQDHHQGFPDARRRA